jgi:hypothetical protein
MAFVLRDFLSSAGCRRRMEYTLFFFDVICLGLMRHNPSRIPLSRKASSTCEVMFTNPRREGMFKHSSFLKDFIFTSGMILR